MKNNLEKMFEFVRAGDLKSLEVLLTTNHVHDFLKIDERHSEFVNDKQHIERKNTKLSILHEAIRCRFSGAVKLILDRGGNLFREEEIETETQIEKSCFNTWDTSSLKYCGKSALALISESGDLCLIQMAFDKIASSGIAAEEFLYKHLHQVDCSNFKARLLNFDVGKSLPTNFQTPQELKERLVQGGADISGVFFTRSDYLNYFESEMRNDVPLLVNALKCCNFNTVELGLIYATLKTDRMKTVMVDHNPNVDHTYAAALAEKRKKEAERDRQSAARLAEELARQAAVEQENRKRVADEKEYQHLTKRLGVVNGRLADLESKNKLTKKEKEELNVLKRSRTICTESLHHNPFYQSDNNGDEEGNDRELKRRAV